MDLAVAGTTNGVAHFRNLGSGVLKLKTNVVSIGTSDDSDFPQPAYYLKSFRPPNATKEELVAARAQRTRVYVLATGADGRLAVQGTLTNIGVSALDVGPPTKFNLPDPVPTTGLAAMSLPSAQNSRLFSVEAADFDHDGDVDLAVGFWDCRVGFYRGHGNGTFTFAQAHALFREPRALTAGDYEKDGALDLVCASLYNELALLKNMGDILTATNLAPTILPTDIYNVGSIKAYDENGDADLDLLLVGSSGAALFIGGPGFTFTRSTNAVSLPGLAASSVATADFDGDGDIAIASACATLACVSISLRNALGEYVPLLTARVPSAVSSRPATLMTTVCPISSAPVKHFGSRSAVIVSAPILRRCWPRLAPLRIIR